MDLSYSELDKYLTKVFTGQDMVSINSEGIDKCVVFKHPTNEMKIMASFIYEESYRKGIEDGLLPKEKLEKLISDRNIFTEDDKTRLDKLDSKLKGQEFLLSKTTKVQANADRILNVISNIKREMREVLSRRDRAMSMSAEVKAEEDMNLYLCWNCTYEYKNAEKVLHWNSYKSLMEDEDVEFRNAVLGKFLRFYNGMDTSLIRCIARSNLWRIRYINSIKASDSLFGVPTSEYTVDMLNLVYWSNFYQNVYDMMPKDRPADDIIENDELLDAFMKDYYEEVNKEMSIARGSKRRGQLDAFNSQEVIVTRFNELYEEIKYDKPLQAQRAKGANSIKDTGKRSKRKTIDSKTGNRVVK